MNNPLKSQTRIPNIAKLHKNADEKARMMAVKDHSPITVSAASANDAAPLSPQSRSYFGTDGIRGCANIFPMTVDMALRVAMATARVMKRDQTNAIGHAGHSRVLIGKDTRSSGYMLEQAMAAGFLAMGMEVVLTGPIPTPAVAMLTRSLRADIGVMISASHNKFQDNGIKLFGHDGYKLPDQVEHEIEEWIDRDDLTTLDLPTPEHIGHATRMEDAVGRYVEFVKSSFPRGQTLNGLKIVVDCAHGAAYRVAPLALWELEADVIAISTHPNGRNINHECGATHTDLLRSKVVEMGADVGIALDGDADRLIMVDEHGEVIDGDQLIALLATYYAAQGKLAHKTVVTTVMSNLGMERYLAAQNITLLRTAVGDRYVVERMRDGGFNLGGEQSGHIILSDFGTTGDGLMAALQVLSILKDRGGKASDLLRVFTAVPQKLKNIKFESGRKPLDQPEVQEAIKLAETKIAGTGRLLVRASGTEPLIRIMVEADDPNLIDKIIQDLSVIIEKN